MLKTTKLAPDFDFEKLIEATAGFSGSDLKEICRNAAMIPVREYVRSVEPKDHDGDASSDLLGIDMEVMNCVTNHCVSGNPSKASFINCRMYTSDR